MFRLLRHFSIVSAVAVLLSAIVLVQAYQWDQTNEHVLLAETGNQQLAKSFSGAFWNTFLPAVSALSRIAPDERRERGELRALDIALRSLVGSQPILKIKIFDGNGSVLYSFRRDEVGRSEANSPQLRSALAGQTSSSLVFKDRFDAMEGPMADRWIVETYLPLLAVDGKIDAVFELYTDVTASHDRLQQSMTKAALLILACFAGLYGALVLVVRRADNLLRLQTSELEASRSRSHDQKESLRHLLDAVGEGIVGLDSAGSVTFINPAAADLIACRAGDGDTIVAHCGNRRAWFGRVRRDGPHYARCFLAV